MSRALISKLIEPGGGLIVADGGLVHEFLGKSTISSFREATHRAQVEGALVLPTEHSRLQAVLEVGDRPTRTADHHLKITSGTVVVCSWVDAAKGNTSGGAHLEIGNYGVWVQEEEDEPGPRGNVVAGPVLAVLTFSMIAAFFVGSFFAWLGSRYGWFILAWVPVSLLIIRLIGRNGREPVEKLQLLLAPVPHV